MDAETMRAQLRASIDKARAAVGFADAQAEQWRRRGDLRRQRLAALEAAIPRIDAIISKWDDADPIERLILEVGANEMSPMTLEEHLDRLVEVIDEPDTQVAKAQVPRVSKSRLAHGRGVLGAGGK
jgi:hypothetical protein